MPPESAGSPPPPLAPEAAVDLFDPVGRLTRWYCTPRELDELAAGWLVGEARAKAGEIGPIEVDPDARVVRLLGPAAPIRREPVDLEAGHTATGGSATAAARPGSDAAGDAAGGTADRTADRTGEDEPAALHAWFREMFERGVQRERSGGVHTGALVRDGRIVVVREDVSRHCVVDKLLGYAVLASREPGEQAPEDGAAGATILLSGRISGAIAAKAVRAGVTRIATMSIPTTLAADIAARAGVVLVGRARTAAPHVYRSPRG